MIITPSKEAVEHSLYVISQHAIGNRGTFDGDYHQQLFGLQAQIIICDLLGLKRPEATGCFDGGFDVEYCGKKLDVKCEIRTVDFKNNFVHNVSAFQIKYIADGFIFLSYNKEKGEFKLCGWIMKEDFVKKSTLFKKGDKRKRTDGSFMDVKSDYYEIENKYLNKWQKLK